MKKIFVSVVVILMIGLLVIRLPYRTIHNFPHFNNSHTLINKLNLTDEQIKKESVIRNETRQKIKPLVEKIRTRHEEIKKLAETEPIDSPKIASRQKEIHDLSLKVNEIHKKHLAKFNEILTQEQKEKFHRIIESNKNP